MTAAFLGLLTDVTTFTMPEPPLRGQQPKAELSTANRHWVISGVWRSQGKGGAPFRVLIQRLHFSEP